jgi:HAD superfamily hydrolase (TIGR01549 family)
MKKLISFDLDGTLVDAAYGNVVWNHGIPEEYAKKYGMPFEEARDYIMNEYRAVGDGDILWYHIEHWLARFDLPVRPSTLLDRFEAHIAAYDGVAEVLQQLSRKGYRMIVASNAARIFVEKELAFTGLEPFFERIISATSDYRIVKKGEAFYRRLLAELDMTPEELVHVGDHPVFDHDAPRSAGIEAYFLDKAPSVKNGESGGANGRRVIVDLRELLESL